MFGGGGGTRPCTDVTTFEAVAGSWRSESAVNAPAVTRVMGGAPMRNNNSPNIVYTHNINVGEMCFIPLNVGPTRLNCSMVFVTVFVSSDGCTFRLFSAVPGSHETV